MDTPTLESIQQALLASQQAVVTAATIGLRVKEVERQLQLMQGQGGLAEPLSLISGWNETAPQTTPATGTQVGMGQVLLAGPGIKFEKPANSPFLRIKTNGAMNADYVVDSNGGGTHTALYGASGALAAAITTGLSKDIWICTTHVESTVTVAQSLDSLAANQVIMIFSGSQYRPTLTVGASIDLHATSTLNVGGTRIIYRNVQFSVSNTFTANLFSFQQAGATPSVELDNVNFAGAGTWLGVVINGVGLTGNLDLRHCTGTVTQITTVGGVSRTNGNLGFNGNTGTATILAMHMCRMTLTNLVFRIADTHADAATLYDFSGGNDLTLSSYMFSMTVPESVVVVGNTIIAPFNGPLMQFGNSGSQSAGQAVVTGNRVDMSGGGASSRVIFCPSTTANGLAVTGNDFYGPGTAGCLAIEMRGATSDTTVIEPNAFYNWSIVGGVKNVGGTGQQTTFFGSVAFSVLPSGLGHNILSATHLDSVAAAVVRGDLIIGNSTPAWARLPVGAAGSVVSSNGTDPSWTINPLIAGYTFVGGTAPPAHILAGDLTATRIFALDRTVFGNTNLTVQDKFYAGDYTSTFPAIFFDDNAFIGWDRAALQWVWNTPNGSGGTEASMIVRDNAGVSTMTVGIYHGVVGNLSLQANASAPSAIIMSSQAIAGEQSWIFGPLGNGAKFAISAYGVADLVYIDAPSGNLRNLGYFRAGSLSAPTNTTAGDLTAQRAFILGMTSIGSASVLSSGNVLGLTGNLSVGGVDGAGFNAMTVTLTTALDTTRGVNIAMTLNNSVALTGIPGAFQLTFTDTSTANRLSGQVFRFIYQRNAGTTGVPTAGFDAMSVFTPVINENAAFVLSGYRAEGPTVAAGKTLTEWRAFEATQHSGTITAPTGLFVDTGYTLAVRALSGTSRFVSGLNIGTDADPTSGYLLELHGSQLIANNSTLAWKDSVGTARTVIYLASDNNVNIFNAGGAGKKVRTLNQAGSVETFGIDDLGDLNWIGWKDASNIAVPANPAAGAIREFSFAKAAGAYQDTPRWLDSSGHDSGPAMRAAGIIGLPIAPSSNVLVTTAVPSSTLGFVGVVCYPAGIYLNNISYVIGTAATGTGAESVRIALYTMSGSLITGTNVTDTPGLATGVRTVSLGANVYLPAGYYYQFVCMATDSNLLNPAIDTFTQETTFNSAAAGGFIETGTVVCVGGAAPATLGIITIVSNRTPYFKLGGVAT